MTEIPVEHLEGMRVKPLSLRANFSWTFAGNLIYAASQWGVLVVLAKLGSPGMYIAQIMSGSIMASASLAATAPGVVSFSWAGSDPDDTSRSCVVMATLTLED